jgi:hypothetical protein
MKAIANVSTAAKAAATTEVAAAAATAAAAAPRVAVIDNQGQQSRGEHTYCETFNKHS